MVSPSGMIRKIIPRARAYNGTKTRQRLLRGQITTIRIFAVGLLIIAVYLTWSSLSQQRNYYQDYHSEKGRVAMYYTIEAKNTPDPVLAQPRFYPWYKHTAGPEQHWNFSLFWDRVNNRIPWPDSGGQLYAVKSGKLYQKVQTTQSKIDNLRAQPFEQLASFSLHMAKSAFVKQNNQTAPWVPGPQQLFGEENESFPVFFNWSDFRNCYEKTYPLLTLATYPSETEGESCIPLGIPTYARWGSHKRTGYPDEWDPILQARQRKYAWESKIKKAVWRGSTTGFAKRYPNWRDLPRAKLVQYSLNNPNIIDAGFSNIVQRTPAETKEISASKALKKSMSMEDFQRYKAVIDIDGNSWSSRFANLLCMNSVIIKVDPEWVDYFHAELQPWVHYVPVYNNLSNLVDVVSHVLQEDLETQRQMQTIVHNANDFCRSKMTSSQMAVDMVWILISYLEILKKEDSRSGNFTRWKEKWSADWPASEWKEVHFLK